MVVNDHDGDGRLIHDEVPNLQWDTNTNYRVVFIVYKYLGIAAERSSTLCNRMRPKQFAGVVPVATFAIGICTATRPAILDLQQQGTVLTRYLNPGVTAKGMAPDIAETLGDNLKQLRRQAIVDFYLAVRSDVDFDSRDQ